MANVRNDQQRVLPFISNLHTLGQDSRHSMMKRFPFKVGALSRCVQHKLLDLEEEFAFEHCFEIGHLHLHVVVFVVPRDDQDHDGFKSPAVVVWRIRQI